MLEENVYIETMNVQQLSLKLRALGMKVSEVTLSQGIEQGVYPFGHCIRTESGGRRFEVFSRLVDKWIQERAVPRKPPAIQDANKEAT